MRITRKALVVAGFMSILIGLTFLIDNLINITGFAVFNEATTYMTPWLTLFFITAAIILFTSALEKKVVVYDASGTNGTNEEKHYHITDPDMYFGTGGGAITLSQFRREIDNLKKDSALIEVVQEAYGPQLVKMLESPEDKRKVVEKFLEALYGPEKARDYIKAGQPTLSSEGETEIRNAFKPGWKGKPSTEQNRILRKYGLGFEVGGRHGRIYSEARPELFRETSLSPSDINAGRQVGKDVIKIIKDQYSKK